MSRMWTHSFREKSAESMSSLLIRSSTLRNPFRKLLISQRAERLFLLWKNRVGDN